MELNCFLAQFVEFAPTLLSAVNFRHLLSMTNAGDESKIKRTGFL